jgi:prepilin-type N-terminal cleavage/methylation domain-containing protein
MKRKNLGFTLVEIMIVVAIIGLLAAIAIPSFVKARNTSQQNACINNLRQIDAGKEQWAMAAKKTDGDTVVTESVNDYIKGQTTPRCPGGGTYHYLAIGTNPDCTVSAPTSHNFAG